jgi:hypothetical protein
MHPNPFFCGVRVAQYLFFCVLFCRYSIYSFYSYSIGHNIVCPSLPYGFWLPLWYFQAVLNGLICICLFLYYIDSQTVIKIHSSILKIKTNLILDGRYVAKQKVLQCKGPSSNNPIANKLFKCNLNDSYIIQFDSGDEYIFIIYY